MIPAVVVPFSRMMNAPFSLAQAQQISTCWLEDAKSETIRRYLFTFLPVFLMQLL